MSYKFLIAYQTWITDYPFANSCFYLVSFTTLILFQRNVYSCHVNALELAK